MVEGGITKPQVGLGESQHKGDLVNEARSVESLRKILPQQPVATAVQ